MSYGMATAAHRITPVKLKLWQNSAKPLKPIMKRYGVSALFHGHDHLYAKQDLDGIVYQEVPQPSAKNTNNGASLAQSYHYAAGTILASAGHLRVTVSPTGVTGEYVRGGAVKESEIHPFRRWFEDHYTIQFDNYPVDEHYTPHGTTTVPCRPPGS